MPYDTDRRDYLRLAGTGLAAAFAGCAGGGGNGDDSTPSDGTETGNGSTPEGGTTLTYWSAFFDDEILDPWNEWYVQTVEEELNVSIDLVPFQYQDLRQNYLTGARTGTPDLIEGVLSHVSDYTKADLLEPLDESVQNKDNYDGFIDSSIDALRYQDQLYGLPLDGNGRGLLYRKDILEEYGFEPPETAQELHEIGREINQGEEDMAGYKNVTAAGDIRGFQEWISHVYQHADALYEVDGDSWTVVPSADTLGQIFDNWYYQIWAVDNPVADPNSIGTGYEQLDSAYARGNFAMCPNGPWVRSSQADAGPNSETILNEHTAVTHLPHAEGAERGTYLEVEWAGLNSHSEHMDTAWEALDIYTSTESFQLFAENDPGNWVTPIHEDIESTMDDEDWLPFTEIIETGTALAFVSWGSTREALYNSMQRVAYGESDPYNEAEQFHSTLQDIAQNEFEV
ncbi:ABC transporter substrate-binding protein [Halopenitus salinus]|uniref:ABC transporter substrate-binding protein n=1 Tax=Halopenitus salinus TaxID=1198295 RepID=A0ABD5UXC5_9EURY